VSSEGLLSKFLIASVLDGVDLKSMRVAIDIMILREEIRDWVDSEGDEQSGVNHDLLIWNLGARDEHEVLRHVMSHLWGRSWSAIFILDHTIMKLRRHSNNHVIVVWVEMSTLWDVETEWRIVVVSSQQIVWIVDQTRVMRSSLG
tara:strand:+ start:78 stop:512 length:435 start_codon:yes stop_codon:yes gene_type:complete